jgi:hypothetical protein
MRSVSAADAPNCSVATFSPPMTPLALWPRPNKLGTAPVRKIAERFTVLTYTSLHPETLPSSATHALSSHNLHTFSIGTCYARTDTYPTGVYWVVLSLE